jgi:GNAT superfamily N-acetyltransferase
LVVDGNYRGKGVGRALINKVKEWSANKGIVKLRVRCNVKRTETHKFYKNLGFKETKEQKIFELDI